MLLPLDLTGFQTALNYGLPGVPDEGENLRHSLVSWDLAPSLPSVVSVPLSPIVCVGEEGLKFFDN